MGFRAGGFDRFIGTLCWSAWDEWEVGVGGPCSGDGELGSFRRGLGRVLFVLVYFRNEVGFW